MKEPHRKGVAIHPDLESCAGGGDIAGEALTEAPAGRVWSRERTRFGHRRHALMRKATPTRTPSRVCVGPGAVGRRCDHLGGTPGTFPHENRETSFGVCRESGRPVGAGFGRTAHAHAGEESDNGVVLRKQPNNSGKSPRGKAEAEAVEGSPLAKENAAQPNAGRTPSPGTVTLRRCLDALREPCLRPRCHSAPAGV